MCIPLYYFTYIHLIVAELKILIWTINIAQELLFKLPSSSMNGDNLLKKFCWFSMIPITSLVGYTSMSPQCCQEIALLPVLLDANGRHRRAMQPTAVQINTESKISPSWDRWPIRLSTAVWQTFNLSLRSPFERPSIASLLRKHSYKWRRHTGVIARLLVQFTGQIETDYERQWSHSTSP